jgi:hypothetical protein
MGLTLAALLLLGAVVWAIGSMLPIQHRASASRLLAADADSVWRRIDRVGEWPTWQDLTVELVAEDTVRVAQEGQVLLYHLDRSRRRTLVTEIVTPGLPFGGRWTWSVTPNESGSAVVTIVEDGEVYDPLFRFFGRFVFGHDRSIHAALDALEASFEHGLVGARAVTTPAATPPRPPYSRAAPAAMPPAPRRP